MLKAHVIEITKACVAAFMKARNSLEHVYMRPEVNSNRFDISLRGKSSLQSEVTSLSAFT